MNRQVNAIAGRLSLRPPQRQSLEILDRIAEKIVPSRKGNDPGGAGEPVRGKVGGGSTNAPTYRRNDRRLGFSISIADFGSRLADGG
jgi:hypothetical protein